MRNLRIWIGWMVLLSVPSSLAGDTGPRRMASGQASIATEHLRGTTLQVTPQIAWERAVLRVSGPGDYSLTKRFLPGPVIAADLLTEARPREAGQRLEREPALSDGLYRYEVVFASDGGEPVSYNGSFFVEAGAAVGRASKQDTLTAIRRDLARRNDDRDSAGAADEQIGGEATTANDYLRIEDLQNDGMTFSYLDSDYPGGAAGWSLFNVYGELWIYQVGGSGNGLKMTIEEGGQVGIGTGNPQQELHIVGSDGGDILLDGPDGEWIVGNAAGTGELVIQDVTGPVNVIRIVSGAPGNSLVIEADGRIGTGVAVPESDFHLANVDGAGDTVFKIARSGTGSWNLGHTATGVFTFNRTGTGGQEFTVRNRNDVVATLDVQGHVRGTSFKNSSSRALKTGFETVDSSEILRKLSELPVTSWRYRADGAAEKHIGPVAEDFERLFGLGDGRTITTVDTGGVLMAAVQGLNARLELKQAEIDELRQQLTDLRRRIDELVE